jgi:CHAT domain-containing protein
VLRATPWFADAHALVQIPSLQSLAYLRCFNTGDNRRPDGCPTSDTPTRASVTPSTRTTHTAASGFAGFGDPVLSGAAVKRGGRSAGVLPPVDASGLTGRGVTQAGAPLMNPDELRALARLPGTRTELEAVGKLLGAPAGAIRLDASMTEAALRSADLSNVSILHLATHGLTASEAGQRGARSEPGLVFTPPAQATSEDDGYLAASEVLTLNLTGVDWVILSACNTAAPSGTPGEPGLSGLARAFFYAGAPSLLVSHWPVGDDVAAALTVNTLRRTQAGETRATALQNAMRDIRNDPNNPTFAHPSAWAPFTIAGEGR